MPATLSNIKPSTVLIVGDLILDSYTIGSAERISPEAPVPVVHVKEYKYCAGGVGNAALNLKGLGAEVRLLGRIGNDAEGQRLRLELQNHDIATDSLVVQSHYPTPTKNRVIAGGQQIVRIDQEVVEWLPEQLEQQIIEKLPSLLESVTCLAVSDYGKGFLTDTLLKELIERALLKNIPIVVDPKGLDFGRYRGATVIKPNAKEAFAAAQIAPMSSLEAAAQKLLEVTQAEVLMITRSEQGISLYYRDQRVEHFPVQQRQVKDVTGAGDTVLATVAFALASDLTASQAAVLANLAAGVVIEHLGCATVSLADIAAALLKSDAAQKLYDEEHLFAIQEVLRGEPFAVLGLYQEQGITPLIYKGIKEVAARYPNGLIVYMRDKEPDELFIEVLMAIPEVKFVILKSDCLQNLCRQMSPDQIYIVEKGEVVEANDYFVLVRTP